MKILSDQKIITKGALLLLLVLGAYGLASQLNGQDQSKLPDDSSSQFKPAKYNILFFSIDDLAPRLGCYGDSLAITPNLDRFAQEGALFTQTYSQAAVCAPSRASLMTGLRPDSNRVWHLGDKFREKMPDVTTMPQYFHEQGYYTVNIGKIFHNYMPDSVSWDEPDLRPEQYKRPEWLKRDGETFYVNKETNRHQKTKRDSLVKLRPDYYADGWNNGPAWEMEDVHDSMYYDGAQTELAKRTLSRIAKKKQPFFLGLGFFRPHLPFAAPKKYWDLYEQDKIPLASNPYLPQNAPVFAINKMYELRGYDGFSHLVHPTVSHISEDTARILKHGYYASMSYVDALFGKLMKHLDDLNIANKTIVIVWGDHGWKLGEHNSWCKQTNYNVDTHVPMMIRVPGIKGGITLNQLTELIDMYPTLCDLTGVPKPDYLQGESFLPLLKNPEQQWKSAAFSQFHRRPKVTPDGKRYMGYSMKTDTHHYVEWYYWDHIKEQRGEFVTAELYDNTMDPDENRNIAIYPENKGLIRQLSEQLWNGWRKAMPSK